MTPGNTVSIIISSQAHHTSISHALGDLPSMISVEFGVPLIPGQHHLSGVDNNNMVARVHCNNAQTDRRNTGSVSR